MSLTLKIKGEMNMKTMKQLLIVLGLVSLLNFLAQDIYAMPEVQMYSTSAMLGSGSSLPQAAVTGTTTTYDEPSPAITGPKRARPEDNKDPYEDPLGDALLPFLLLAAGYGFFIARRRALKKSN